MRVLLDTHVLAWALIERGQDALPPRVRGVLRSGVLLYSPISLFEIAQKVRIGRWRAMAPYLGGLPKRLAQQEVSVAQATPAFCAEAGAMAWANRDPSDRVIAATCLVEGLTLVSRDAAFDDLRALSRVWT